MAPCKGIRVPGENDWANENERNTTKRLLGLDSYNIIDNCGHFSFLERPEEVAKIISN